MPELTQDEQNVLELLRRAKRFQEHMDLGLRKAIDDPQKYANPLGMDLQGNLFLDPGEEEQEA